MTGVVVTGPPRSGTSAVTRLLNLAGLGLCTPEDLVGGGRNNPTGHWESKTVLAVNNRLLESAGARWWCPELPQEGGLPAAGIMEEARAAFRSAHTSDPWLCKDPRFAVTLPFWREALDERIATVVVLRRPDEVVASLRRTWPLTVEHATALWVRYVHAAVTVSRGIPSVVLQFPEVLADVERVMSDVATALAPLGIQLREPAARAVRGFLVAPRGTATGVERLPDFAWTTWEQLTSLSQTTDAHASGWTEDPSVERLLGPLREDLRAGKPIDVRPAYARSASAAG